MHCKVRKNDCQGIAYCFCECDRCLDADNSASYYQSDEPNVDAAGQCYSDADPGL